MSETYRELITTPNPTAVTYEDYVRGIEDLFSRLADAGVYKGDRGENLKAAPINLLSQSGSTPLTYESFTDEGKELLRAIFDDKDPAEVFVTGGDVNMLKKLEFFNSVNTYTWWCTDGDTDKKVFPSTAFVYIDPNAAVRDIRDYSCLLTPKLEPNSSTGKYDLHYSKSEVFPSFWYNPLVFNGKGGWCWKINGVNTDIPASAANDTGDYNNKLFLVRKFTERTTEGTTKETFKYYTSINNVVNWYTFEDLQNAEKRTPLDGDIGYCLAEVEEPEPEPDSDGQPVLTKINVINLAVYSAKNWIPASIDRKDVLMKFDELFASYIWDCLKYKEVVADNLFIGADSEGNGVHNITANSNNFRQLDFAFTGEPYEEDPNAEGIIAEIERINSELEKLDNSYRNTSDEARKREIMNNVNTLKNQLRGYEKELEEHEEGINFTSSYKHINFGSESEDESTTKSKVNIYSDTYFNREGTTTFRNNVAFEGNAISDDSESSGTGSYVRPSLTINGYDHIDISNITSTDAQTDPIHIGADIGVGGKLSIEGDLEAEDISSNSVTCVGALRGERLNVRGVTTDDGLVSMSKAIISKNGKTITAVPENINSSNITKYLGDTAKTRYLSSIGRTYLGDYASTGSKSDNSAAISKSFSEGSKYVFGLTTVPANNTLEFTYKGFGVAASIYYRHFTDVNFRASMSYKIQVKFRKNGTYSGSWITFYSGDFSGGGWESGNNKTWKTTYRYLICSLDKGYVNKTALEPYYTITQDTSTGKIKITPTSTATSSGYSFDIRVVVSSISSSVEDDTVWWKGVGGVGIGNIGIVSGFTDNSFINSANIGNYINLYTTPVSLDASQAVLFSNALLIGNSSSYFYFKIKDNKVYICGSSSGVSKETSRSIFNLTDGTGT